MVERLALTLDFSSGHDLMVCELEPRVRLCADSAKPAWDSLCVSLSQKETNLKKNLKKKKREREPSKEQGAIDGVGRKALECWVVDTR